MLQESTHMEIVERTVSEVTVLDLQGRLVAGDGDQALIDAVNALVRNGCRNVLLNLAKVVYLDSAGVGAIVSKYITLRSRGGDLKVCHLRERFLKEAWGHGRRYFAIPIPTSTLELYKADDSGVSRRC